MFPDIEGVEKIQSSCYIRYILLGLHKCCRIITRPAFNMLPLSTYISALPLTIITAVLPLATSAQSINGTALSSCAASVNSALPSPVPADFTFSGNVRQYYIAAEEIDWNFIPTGWDNWLYLSPSFSLAWFASAITHLFQRRSNQRFPTSLLSRLHNRRRLIGPDVEESCL